MAFQRLTALSTIVSTTVAALKFVYRLSMGSKAIRSLSLIVLAD